MNQSGWVVLNAAPHERPKTIAIGGVARGGTSLAASLVYRLGIPFVPRVDQGSALTPSLELKTLQKAGVAEDTDALRAAVAEMDAEYDVWAWKLPKLGHRPDLALDNLRHPHFVFVMKEPLSIRMRGHALKSAAPMRARDLKIDGIVRLYNDLLAFCRSTNRPVFIFSYDKAMRDMAGLLAALAEFLGVDCADPEVIVQQITDDQQTYLAGMTNDSPEARKTAKTQAGWQPIETAPKDGTVILIGGDALPHATSAAWCNGRWRVFGAGKAASFESSEFGFAPLTADAASLWMPLPEGSAGSAIDEDRRS